MIQLIKDLNRTSKKAPKRVRAITLYNIVNFISTVVLTFGFALVTVLFAPQLDIWSQLVLIAIPLIFVIVNYIVLLINEKFIYGSVKAYWILLIFLLIQCVGLQVGNFAFELNLGGIPLVFTLTLGSFSVQLNFAAIIFTGYLISVKDEYYRYVEAMKVQNADHNEYQKY